MKNVVLYTAGAVLVAKVAKTALFFRFLANNPPPPEGETFEQAKLPPKIDMKIEGSKHAAQMVYHSFGAAYWAARRTLANERMRAHTRFFEHETEVTKFKRELDGE